MIENELGVKREQRALQWFEEVHRRIDLLVQPQPGTRQVRTRTGTTLQVIPPQAGKTTTVQ